mmetsp:Transcript_632/g.1856  ORF Transcript_632/g.1856 Transcript_632/m.1856 type:complete len:510 (+) Transcript_632:1264-2793(+)
MTPVPSRVQICVEFGNLLQDARLRGSSFRAPQFGAPVEAPHLAHVARKQVAQRLQILQAQVTNSTALLLRQRNRFAGDVMGIPERHTLPHEVLRQVSCQHVGGEALLHLLWVNCHRAHDPDDDLHRVHYRVHHVEKHLLVLLKVLVVRRWGPLHHRQYASKGPKGAASLSSQELQGVRVLLLRHQRGPGRVRVGHAHVPKLRGRVHDEVLGPPGKVGHDHHRAEYCLDHPIPVGHGVHAVWANSVEEPELLGHALPVDVERVAGKSSGSQREPRHPRDHVPQPLVIPLESGAVRQKPVAPPHRLRRLKVGESWHDCVHLLLGPLPCNPKEGPEVLAKDLEPSHGPEPPVGCHLVVPRPPRVKLLPRVPDELHQPPLVRRVDILVVGSYLERAPLPLLPNRLQPTDYGLQLLSGDDPLRLQGLGVHNGPIDVLPPHPLVVRQALVVLVHQGIRLAREPPAPELLCLGRRRRRHRRHRPRVTVIRLALVLVLVMGMRDDASSARTTRRRRA